MNEQYGRFESNYLDQEPAIILEQNPQNNQRTGEYYEYEENRESQHIQKNGGSKNEESEEPVEGEGEGEGGEVEEGEGEGGEDLMGDSVFSNVGQGLTGQYRNMMMAYWQETINSIEHEEHDFKNHQLPLARIKKVMKTDEEVRMISAEAPILFAKGCDIFITELTMRAWIHAEENKRRTLQRSDIAAALQKSDMFDFLIDIVPREEVLGNGGGGGSSGQGKKNSSRQNSSINTNFPNEYQGNYLSQSQPATTATTGGNFGDSNSQNFLKNDNERNNENYQYNDMNVYENRY